MDFYLAVNRTLLFLPIICISITAELKLERSTPRGNCREGVAVQICNQDEPAKDSLPLESQFTSSRLWSG